MCIYMYIYVYVVCNEYGVILLTRKCQQWDHHAQQPISSIINGSMMQVQDMSVCICVQYQHNSQVPIGPLDDSILLILLHSLLLLESPM